MTNSTPAAASKRALLDTTLQLDRKKMPARAQHIDKLLTDYGMCFSTSISLLEFKATLIEHCITIHNSLRRSGARFTRVRDKLLESSNPQSRLRTHIFNNIIGVFSKGTGFETDEMEERELTEKACLALENAIPELYSWFVNESAAAVLKERIACTRAEERPQKKRAAFETNLPLCKRSKNNKFCHVEEVIRREGPALVARLGPLIDRLGKEKGKQLETTVTVFNKVIDDPRADISWRDCRSAGDSLIAIEGTGHATHSLSTNAREWEPISELLGLTFVKVDYGTPPEVEDDTVDE